MTSDQLIRLILERAIGEGVVLPATGRLADPGSQKRTYEVVKDMAEIVIRWQKGRQVFITSPRENVRYD